MESFGDTVEKVFIKSKKFNMPFGKYKGFTVRHILIVNPSYILWLNDNNVAKVCHRIYDEAYSNYEKEVSSRANYYSRVAHNYSAYYEDFGEWMGGDPGGYY